MRFLNCIPRFPSEPRFANVSRFPAVHSFKNGPRFPNAPRFSSVPIFPSVSRFPSASRLTRSLDYILLTRLPDSMYRIQVAFDVYDLHSYVDSTPFLSVSGETIPAMDQMQSYKYLGLPISSRGAEKNVLPKLRYQLENIDRAPLKLQQRLFIVKQNVIPATYHQLVLGKVSKGLLNGLDCKIR